VYKLLGNRNNGESEDSSFAILCEAATVVLPNASAENSSAKVSASHVKRGAVELMLGETQLRKLRQA
jgi:hypothetical protein